MAIQLYIKTKEEDKEAEGVGKRLLVFFYVYNSLHLELSTKISRLKIWGLFTIFPVRREAKVGPEMKLFF